MKGSDLLVAALENEGWRIGSGSRGFVIAQAGVLIPGRSESLL
jgi:hypothetical protein